MNSEIIRFGNEYPTLLEYDKRPWHLNEKHLIEFYPNFVISVLLISADDPHLQKHLNEISNDNSEPISLDLEWNDEICLFQFCATRSCLVIRHSKGPGNPIIRSFLEKHSFYGKGNHNDIQKLNEKFGSEFKIELEDIERTRLIPNGFSTNFVTMSEQFAGKSTAMFKDKEMTFSDWESETLSMRQVMYAAFDVVALFKCYSNFPPCATNRKPIKIKKKNKNTQKSVSFDPVFRRKYPIVSPYSNDFSKKIFCYILKNYNETENIYEMRNKIINIVNDFDAVDFISFIKNEDNKVDVLVSLFDEINEDNLNSKDLSCDNIIIVPDIEFKYFTKDDIFYLNEVPDNLMYQNEMNDFLSNFGTDFAFILYENKKYASVKPNDPYASLRLIKFLPYVSKMTIHEFPSFLPDLLIHSQINISNSDIFNLLKIPENQQQSIEIKTISQKNKYIVTFSSIKEKEYCFETFIKSNKHGKEITVLPFASDDQIKLMQSFTIILKNCQLEITSIYEMFRRFGQIFSISKDDILNIIYIQYRSKADAYHALSKMKEEIFKDDIEILKGKSITIRNFPEDITENEIFNICKERGEILEINMNDKRFIKMIIRNQIQAENLFDELKNTNIRGKQIQVEKKQEVQNETPYWKIQQMLKWVKIKIDKDINNIFMKASQFGKIIDIKVKEDIAYIMFSNEESSEKMKSEIKESEDCDQQTFTLFLNKSLITQEDKKSNSQEDYPSYMNRKVFILDPKPEILTDEILAEKAFKWRSLISGAHNVDSLVHVGKKRTIFYSGGKKRDQQIINLINNLGIELGDSNHWKPITLTYSKANKFMGVPPPPIKKARRWVIIDPVPHSMTEETIRNLCAGEEPFDVMFQNSSTQNGEKRAVILKEPHARNIFWKLKDFSYEGVSLNVIKIAPEYAPQPLD